MSENTDHDNGKPAAPGWWEGHDAGRPPANVTTLHPTGVAPPTSPPPPPIPPPPPPVAVPPAQDGNADGWPDRPAVPPVPAPVTSTPAKARPDRLRNARGAASRNRRWIAVGGAVLLGVVGLNWWANDLATSVGNGVAEPLDAHNQAITDMVAGIASSKSAPSQVSVQQPLSWLNCPVTGDAGTMIGFDPKTNYATLDPERAARVETQVRALVVQNPLQSLRITADSPTSLTVMVGGTKGVPLVDCTAGATPPRQGDSATTPTTAATR